MSREAVRRRRRGTATALRCLIDMLRARANELLLSYSYLAHGTDRSFLERLRKQEASRSAAAKVKRRLLELAPELPALPTTSLSHDSRDPRITELVFMATRLIQICGARTSVQWSKS